MGRVEENKKRKKEALFRTAYELFTTKGINSTAISDIVEKAGVAKGTFYLYFKDKYDIKNKLIAHKTKELFDHAAVALENSGITGLEDQLVFIIDDIINILVANKPLLNFISKNLVMGALKSAFWSEEESDKIFYERYLELVEADTYNYKDIDIMLFTILELAELVIELTGSKSKIVRRPLPSDDPKQRRPDTAKAEKLLKWQATTPLREGLTHTIAYFDKLLKEEPDFCTQ